MDLTDIRTIKGILRKHNFNFSHSLGQNFIINPEVCPKMAKMSGTNEETGVLEIGPGIGVLTKELAKLSKKVVAIELDKRLIPVLEDTLSNFKNIEIVNQDILRVDLKSLLEEKFQNFKDIVICANLPYYITSPIIVKIFEENLPIKSTTVMVQKEVAERICAEVGSKNSSNLTVSANYYSFPEFLFEVKKDNFIPSPKVDSAVIKLNIHDKYKQQVKNEKIFFKVVKAAFSQRRKTILNSLANGLKLDKEKTKVLLEKTNIKENLRAENLTMEQFIKLSNELSMILEKLSN